MAERLTGPDQSYKAALLSRQVSLVPPLPPLPSRRAAKEVIDEGLILYPATGIVRRVS